MSEEKGHGWTALTADNPIIHDAIVLKRIQVNADTDYGEFHLYHGTTPQGRLIHEFKADRYGQPGFDLNIRLPDGLYVDLVSNITSLLIIWEPLEV